LNSAGYDCCKSAKAGGDAAMLMFGILGGVLGTLFFGALFTGEPTGRH
jgi:hypothetical protein